MTAQYNNTASADAKRTLQTVGATNMIVQVYAFQNAKPEGEWHYEVETDDGLSTQDPGAEVIHTDGFYPTKLEAIDAGVEWATSQGHTVYFPPGILVRTDEEFSR